MPPAVDDAKALNKDEIQILWNVVNAADKHLPNGPQSAQTSKVLFELYDEHIGRQPYAADQQRKFFQFLLHLVASPVRDETSLQDRFLDIFQAAGIELFSTHLAEDEDDGVAVAIEDDGVGDEESRAPNGHVDRWLKAQHELEFSSEVEAADRIPPGSEQVEGRRSISQPVPRRPSISRDELGRLRMVDLPLRGRRQSRASSVNQASRFGRSLSRANDATHNRASSVDAGALPADEQKQRWRDVTSRANELLHPHVHDDGTSQAIDSAFIEQAEAFRDNKDLVKARTILRRWVDKSQSKSYPQHEAGKIHTNPVHNQARRQVFQEKLTRLERESAEKHRRFEDQELERLLREKDAAFAVIDAKAAQAYNGHIKELALSQWNAVCIDRADLVEVARRHLKKFRCLNAWDRLTSDEIQERSQLERVAKSYHDNGLLRKTLGWWLLQTQSRVGRDDEAVMHYESKLKRRILIYHLLETLYAKCSHRHNSNVAKRCFFLWQRYVLDLRTRLETLQQQRTEKTKRTQIARWREFARRSSSMNEQARQFRSRHLFSKCLTIWRQSLSEEQRSKRLIRTHQLKLLQSCLANWASRTRAVRRADDFHRRNVQKSAITQLRLRLRARIVSNEVEGRLSGEFLYKWCLSAKAARSCRELEQRLKTNVFNHWANKVFEQRHDLEEAEESFVESRDRRQQGASLQRWRDELAIRQQRERTAQQFREDRLLRTALALWRHKAQHISHLSRRSEAAHFYVLTSRTLKVWLDATTEHQKLRRREAFAEVRRQHKIVLARTALHKIRDVLAHRRALTQIAAERDDDQLINLVVRSWNHWHSAAVQRLALNNRSIQFRRRHLAHLALTKLHSRASNLSRLNLIADSFCQAAVEKFATTCLRRLDRRIFQIQAQGQWAVTLRNRLLEKHIRGMLRYWYERTTAIREGRAEKRGEIVNEEDDISPEDSPDDLVERHDLTAVDFQPEGYAMRDGTDDPEGRRDEEGPSRATTTATGTGTSATLVPYTFTPLPGYLRTPSKRNTALAKARSQLLELGTDPRVAAFAGRSSVGPVGRNSTTPATVPVRSFYGPTTTIRVGEQREHRDGTSMITPFASKLRKQGYRTGFSDVTGGSNLKDGTVAGKTSSGFLNTPVTTTGSHSMMRDRDADGDVSGLRSVRGDRLKTSRLPFAGFDDITEDLDGI